MRAPPPPGCWMQAPARGAASATALTPAMYTLNEDGMLPGTFSSITPVVWSANSSLTPCESQQLLRLCQRMGGNNQGEGCPERSVMQVEVQVGVQEACTCMTCRMGGVAALAAQAAWRLNTSSQNCSASTCVLSVKQRSDVNR